MAFILQLVGPPACGKRTIGAVLAERTGAMFPMPDEALRLDTTNLPAADAARDILAWMYGRH